MSREILMRCEGSRLVDYAIPAIDRFMAYVEFDLVGGCWLWSGPMGSKGRGQFAVAPNRRARAYRFSFEQFKGTPPGKSLVCHRCDVAACVNPDHLFLGTCRDNTADMMAKGRGTFSDPLAAADAGRLGGKAKQTAVGEKCCLSRLTEAEVRVVYGLRGIMPTGKIARQFGITTNNVRSIWNRRTWRHLRMDAGQ